eukprot:CAMPEP_0202895818 /NCGR_PEP_ID=MMETSP1392-20130828/4946_1 /ASSEMBLY_ACC=CAM_ASM_000868 /TAXON_ID=225041 /ORGANISM="Chlamydomonas chlamydogama, Strain SAG 11-48b" /LENGTH=41 /DNA_ID= /DNA_START= /DNA_END= /DNA_ORIENTATION=
MVHDAWGMGHDAWCIMVHGASPSPQITLMASNLRHPLPSSP